MTARYRISRRLGQGGMAEVFEAEAVGEMGFSRKVAIKRMLGDAAADEGSAKRFLDEARIASRLHHANIVSVIDVGLLDGLPFQVLEFVDGIDAQQLQQRAGGVLPLDIALIITAEVAHALDHAHRGEQGMIVHRDVKPSNVLVSWGGDVKLADFGIALAQDRLARTETGMVAGTMGFIAPEQRTRSEVDGRADVFALGLTLHAFLTGYTPLRDIHIEMDLLEGKPVPLDAMLPAEVKALVARAVAPARLDRPSAAEFASAIGALLAPKLTHDARSLLRTFLERLDVSNRPKAGALDALLGIEVVASDVPGEVPQFKTVAVSSSESPTLKAAPPPPRRRLAPYLMLLVLLLGGVAIGTWRFTRSSTPAIPDAAVAIDAAIDVSTEPVITVVERDAGIDAPIDATPTRITKSPDARPDAAVEQPAVTETGWLTVVGGEELVGAQVIVDGGKYKFSVPDRYQVAVGSHSVVVIKRDGTKLPAKTIEVTSFNTMRSPAKLSF